MREPAAVWPALGRLRLGRDDFYFDRHQRLFAAAMYAAAGGGGLVETYERLRQTRDRLDFDRWGQAAAFLCDVWFEPPMPDTKFWCDGWAFAPPAELALAAAAKVQWFARRRRLLHRGRRLIREALNPSGEYAEESDDE